VSRSHYFNLIVTHLPGPEAKRRAIWTLRQLLPGFAVVYSRPNILLGRVNDPLKAVEILKANLPSKTTILRVIPVLEVRSVRVIEVRDAVEKLVANAGEGSFAIRLDGYLEDESGRLMSRMEAIELIARNIDRKVNLKNPDILVYIKTVKVYRRWLSAIYVGRPSNILRTLSQT
jgi:tRNA(Ser,Leu) C12 N-acetylase TAN1